MLLIYTYIFLTCIFLIPIYRLVDIPRLLHHSVFFIFNPIYSKLGLDFRVILFWVLAYTAGFFIFCIGLMRILCKSETRHKITMLTRDLGMAVLDYLVLVFVPILIGIALFLRFLSESLLCVGFILMLAAIFDQLTLSRSRKSKGGGYGKLALFALVGLLILVISLSSFAYMFPLDVEKTFRLGRRYNFILQKSDLLYYWQSKTGQEVKLGENTLLTYLRKFGNLFIIGS